jgi:Lon protease-like protein
MHTPAAHTPRFEDLPQTLPVFPLNGVLLLPRGRLPLNIFEPRYLSMVDDALKTDRLIGMIQPAAPCPDPEKEAPKLFNTGCVGRIISFAETEDGRYLITLAGLSRFSILHELDSPRGYRRVEVDWQNFRHDLDEEGCPGLDRTRMTRLLQCYFEKQGLSANWEAIENTPDERLLTSLAMICPFEPCEKQALLEANSLADRADIMMTLLEMAAAGEPAGASNTEKRGVN